MAGSESRSMRARKSDFRILTLLIGGISVVTAVLLVLVVVLPGVFSGGAHFGFPSKQQASNALGVQVTPSGVVSQSNAYYSGYFVKKAEAVFYNSSSLQVLVTEYQTNSSSYAANLYDALVSGYSRIPSFNATSFTYNSVNVTLFQSATTGQQTDFLAFHASEFICFCLIYNYSPSQSLSAKPFAQAIVSSVV